jgi:hypothetical protein
MKPGQVLDTKYHVTYVDSIENIDRLPFAGWKVCFSYDTLRDYLKENEKKRCRRCGKRLGKHYKIILKEETSVMMIG